MNHDHFNLTKMENKRNLFHNKNIVPKVKSLICFSNEIQLRRKTGEKICFRDFRFFLLFYKKMLILRLNPEYSSNGACGWWSRREGNLSTSRLLNIGLENSGINQVRLKFPFFGVCYFVVGYPHH